MHMHTLTYAHLHVPARMGTLTAYPFPLSGYPIMMYLETSDETVDITVPKWGKWWGMQALPWCRAATCLVLQTSSASNAG